MTNQHYLTAMQCQNCEREHTFFYEGPKMPADQDAPWPNAHYCPGCGEAYPSDLGEIITEVLETKMEIIDPFEREGNDD